MSRNILTIITISFFMINCTFFTNYGRDYKRSHNEYVNQNYDKAIDFCINSLKRNPNYKKSKIMYEKTVPLAINFYHSNIDKYLKDRDKQKIENARPISLVNVDTKSVIKSLATKLKLTLPSIIKSDQTAYVYGRFIGESTQLIMEVTRSLDMEGYLLTMDIQKAFDSVSHEFLLPLTQ